MLAVLNRLFAGAWTLAGSSSMEHSVIDNDICPGGDGLQFRGPAGALVGMATVSRPL